ncbi:Hypothetical protein A7982_00429 [Minicystis rosea]|nr:Hypothetical protein A7982_00429 [Minicystis rosea]
MIRRSAALAVLALALAGCAKEASPAASHECACAGEPVVDPALLAFLSKARAAHHEADIAEDQGDQARAVTALEALIRGPRPKPSSGTMAPEAAEVLADTLARLADLRSKAGDYTAAQRDVDQGLELASRPTHFRGHLFEIAGVVHERRAKALEAAGDKAGAADAKARAIESFETAIKIQDRVIDHALDGGGG